MIFGQTPKNYLIRSDLDIMTFSDFTTRQTIEFVIA